ncbi:hypothetical protein [Anabaena sp. UHCC 0451]|uniref:hypothetical protein n=1 Tax=Anabaena sp. UHCC 0451 TaxID=2055235 RepID=UPI002B215234|nr:hypothetical protein [Anabaena sp. UHCC 0451]MEA5577696.1 hypothetical protein [Anabaena sp. UHCC 0451]
MRKIFLGLLLPLTLTFTPSFALAMEYKSTLDLSQRPDSAKGDNIFYTKAMQLVQQQIHLIARFEQALSSPDPKQNQIRWLAATAFSNKETNLTSSPLPVVGSSAKTAITNYRPSVQPAIAALA